MTVYYLHGFASSPQSTKAACLGDHLRAHRIPLHCPDFNEPDFATLTITRMLDRLERELRRAETPVVLIGSSLGGTLAILAAGAFGLRVDRMVLLAPAVMFAKPGHHLMAPDRLDEWRRRGALPFFHYAYNEERLLNYAFYEDSLRYDAFTTAFTQPALIFQGLRDASVDHRTVEQFAQARPHVGLTLLDDDHQLTGSLPRIWDGTREFMGLTS